MTSKIGVGLRRGTMLPGTAEKMEMITPRKSFKK